MNLIGWAGRTADYKCWSGNRGNRLLVGFQPTLLAQLQVDGTEIWVYSRNGVIVNGGINQTPRWIKP